jgi:hypothetical protein
MQAYFLHELWSKIKYWEGRAPRIVKKWGETGNYRIVTDNIGGDIPMVEAWVHLHLKTCLIREIFGDKGVKLLENMLKTDMSTGNFRNIREVTFGKALFKKGHKWTENMPKLTPHDPADDAVKICGCYILERNYQKADAEMKSD